MLSDMICVFQPAGELAIELIESANVAEISYEELVSNGTKEAFDLAFGCTVSDRCVDQHGAEASADYGEFLGGIVGSVVHINGLGDAALVECSLETIDEISGVVCVIKGTVRNNARSVVDEADEEGLDWLIESIE